MREREREREKERERGRERERGGGGGFSYTPKKRTKETVLTENPPVAISDMLMLILVRTRSTNRSGPRRLYWYSCVCQY